MPGDATSPDDEISTFLRARFDPTPVGNTFLVRVVEGPDRGKSFAVDGAEASRTLLGTSDVCGIRLTDPEVSRRHAALEVRGSRLQILDLQSTNGTSVAGVWIGEAYLGGGELVRVGSTTFEVAAGPASELALPVRASFGKILGASTEMRRLYPLCERLAASLVPVIIEGETGTGKEVLAESLHEESPRASGPFVVFDCTAVPPNLVESELFGHERGSFTGAVASRKGVFEQAHGGTLLIDEIGDLDLPLQPKLLRALERSEVRRVGGDRPIHVDVRVLSATRRDLDAEVQKGRFRDDLFHRLAVTRIELPPLRKRVADLPLLARWFARELGGTDESLPGELLVRWREYDWPGNVRELRNAVARRLALGDLAPEWRAAAPSASPAAPGSTDPALSSFVDQTLSEGAPYLRARKQLLDAFEQRYVERMLAAHAGNVSRAAAASGIARRHFHRLIARGR